MAKNAQCTQGFHTLFARDVQHARDFLKSEHAIWVLVRGEPPSALFVKISLQIRAYPRCGVPPRNAPFYEVKSGELSLKICRNWMRYALSVICWCAFVFYLSRFFVCSCPRVKKRVRMRLMKREWWKKIHGNRWRHLHLRIMTRLQTI